VAIRSDNGPEVSSRHFLAWCIEKRIDAVHIQPGKPTQNALRLASSLGPFRRFNLAHPKLLILR
jgi:transposase InsO family protein